MTVIKIIISSGLEKPYYIKVKQKECHQVDAIQGLELQVSQ